MYVLNLQNVAANGLFNIIVIKVLPNHLEVDVTEFASLSDSTFCSGPTSSSSPLPTAKSAPISAGLFPLTLALLSESCPSPLLSAQVDAAGRAQDTLVLTICSSYHCKAKYVHTIF